MKMQTFENALLRERYLRVEHPSGLTLLLYPRPDLAGTSVYFTTKYGSIDTRIEAPDGSFYRIPEGTAHFLEHKLFESEDLDAFARFAKTGANANAFTSFDRTTYLFSCTDHFAENLEILLDFVQSPYFTAQTVQKEQGIIGQEIRMYKDLPDWEVLFNLLRVMYRHHPVRIDIAGTEETIAEITADMLYDCYRNFYNLNNMVLAVGGNFETDTVLEIVDRCCKPSDGKAIRREFIPEPPAPSQDCIEETLAVTIPQFLLGSKEDLQQPELSEKTCVETEILLDAIAGKSSPLYRSLLDAGLINSSFSIEHLQGFGYSALLFGGASTRPKEAAQMIRDALREIKQNGIDEEHFERARRKCYGESVTMFNDTEAVVSELAEAHLCGKGLFDDFDIIRSLTVDDINARLRQLFREDSFALSVINANAD